MNYANTTSLKECYRMLNISPGVNWSEVKKSYRFLALKFHPDHHPGLKGHEIRFKQISNAFKTLESHYIKSRSQEYESSFDQKAEVPLSSKFFKVDLETSSSDRNGIFESILLGKVNKSSMAELKNHLIEIMGEFEKKAFQLDVEKEIKIDSSTVVKGGMVKVRQNKESFEVPIPKGVWNRMKIRIPNKGEAGWFSNKRGDLLLDIQVISSNVRVYSGERDLYYDFPIRMAAIKSGKMQTLKTTQGVIKFTIPRNAIDGQTFSLKAKPNTETSSNTNHIVRIKVVL